MGVVQNDSTLVAQKPKGIIDPSTGKPVGSDDAYFSEINDELPTRAFSSPRPTSSSHGRAPAR